MLKEVGLFVAMLVTVNLEIFTRVLFSQIALKYIVAALKFATRS